MHQFEELTFESPTFFICAERTRTPRSVFQVLLHTLDLPFEVRHLTIESIILCSA
jgi:hypothetical protein